MDTDQIPLQEDQWHIDWNADHEESAEHILEGTCYK